MPTHPTIREIADFLEQWAPPSSAQSYDNVGLQVGDPDVRVHTGLLALDMTQAVLEEAETMEADLIITHHPLLFRPLKQITTTTLTSNLALRLAAGGIALYSIHTNLDAASGGVSFALGRQLGLKDLEFLDLFDSSDGDEIGFGVIGRVASPMTLETFLQQVCDRLEAPTLRFVGDPGMPVDRVAVCGGAGADLIEKAAARGADVYVTADVKYHEYFRALGTDGQPRLAFVDAGHYETEAITESLLTSELAERFPDTSWHTTRTRTSPVRSFVSAS